MAFLITEISLAQRDTPGFGGLFPVLWHRMITLITSVTCFTLSTSQEST
jgi:hypothetical protein